MGDPDVPVACSLEPVDLDDRVRQWLALAERAMIEKQNVANGVRLRYRFLAGVDTELRRWPQPKSTAVPLRIGQ